MQSRQPVVASLAFNAHVGGWRLLRESPVKDILRDERPAAGRAVLVRRHSRDGAGVDRAPVGGRTSFEGGASVGERTPIEGRASIGGRAPFSGMVDFGHTPSA
jgi:hypothetical protein